MKQITPPISLAGSQLLEVRHVCAFFANDEEEYRVLLPFIREGFVSGDKAVHVINPDQRDEHLRRLTAVGMIRRLPSKTDGLISRTTRTPICEMASSTRIVCSPASRKWRAVPVPDFH